MDNNNNSKQHDFSRLPDELKGIDFSQRITWRKYDPYPLMSSSNDDDDNNNNNQGTSTMNTEHTSSSSSSSRTLPLVPEATPPVYTPQSPALCHQVNALCKRARACTIHLQPQPGQVKHPPRPVQTPIFMPVGTKGCLKGLTVEELMTDPALNCPIILANTYHLALQPGTELLRDMGGLHCYMGQNSSSNSNSNSNTANDDQDCMNYNLLTDSGGFQMVSLAKLSVVTEEGVTFENPFLKGDQGNKNKRTLDGNTKKSDDDDDDDNAMMLLKPEDSIRHQNNIGANIIMALDDVVSSVEVNEERFEMATYRTLRWLDRCIDAHSKPQTQNLFPIVQGGLDTSPGGLRERCLAGFRRREEEEGMIIPGYAIGGLAGGESKDDFWRVVDQCCRALPDDKPRYLMGVGYPLDLVVCTALGVDMYDCVYPTRTARFGVALVPGPTPGTLRLKSHEFATDSRAVQEGCQCQACRIPIPRSRIHHLLKTDNPLAIQLLTQHNIAYMMSLVRNMRKAILEGTFDQFARDFMKDQFRGGDQGVPQWVREALAAACIKL